VANLITLNAQNIVIKKIHCLRIAFISSDKIVLHFPISNDLPVLMGQTVSFTCKNENMFISQNVLSTSCRHYFCFLK